jgi:site-specific DNA-cytosine methylase
MVSILGKSSYSFPKKIELQYNLQDFMDDDVEESYFLPDKWVDEFEEYKKINSSQSKNKKLNLFGMIPKKLRSADESRRRVYYENGLCPTILTPSGGYFEIKVATIKANKKIRIRKLTEQECMRLMGFEKKDCYACKEVGQKKSTIYHQAGDSIVTTCLVGIFGELLGLDYETAINEYTKKLYMETRRAE